MRVGVGDLGLRAPALAEAAQALAGRSRAFKHRFMESGWRRALDEGDGGAIERLDLEFRKTRSRNAARLTVSLRSDHWIWVGACKGAAKGWAWQWSVEGRFAGPDFGQSLVRSIDLSDAAMFGEEADAVTSALTAAWAGTVLSHGGWEK